MEIAIYALLFVAGLVLGVWLYHRSLARPPYPVGRRTPLSLALLSLALLSLAAAVGASLLGSQCAALAFLAAESTAALGYVYHRYP